MSKAARSVALGLVALLLLASCRSLPRVPGLPFGPTATPRATVTTAPAVALGSPFPTSAPVMATPAPVSEETVVPEGEATALPAPPETLAPLTAIPPTEGAATALPAAPATLSAATAVPPEGLATALPAPATTVPTGTAAPLAQAPAPAAPGAAQPTLPAAVPRGPGGAAVTPAPSAPCTTTDPGLELTASATRLQVGQLVTFTVTLRNRGCTGLGLPQYRIDQSTIGWPLNLEPVTSMAVSHEMGIGSNHSDTDVFVMRAAYPGQTTINAFASFEIHEGYPEPAYWGRASAPPLQITVAR